MISVIVPCRDSREILPECLQSLVDQTLAPAELIVVDDASKDGSAALVRERFPEARLIELEQSAGFAGACVAGFEAAAGDWIALINSDAVAHPDWLGEMAAAAELDAGASMIASRVLLAEPEGTVDSLGIKLKRGGMAVLCGHGEPDQPDHALPQSVEVFAPAGSAAMFRRDLLEAVGFFEPGFFIYYEEVDLGLRARWHGAKCLLANRARVIHRHSYVANRLNLDKRRLLIRNRIRVLVRNWPASWLVKDLPWITAYGLAGAGRAFLEGNFAAPFLARLEVLKSLSLDLAAREKTLAANATRSRELRAWLRS